MDEDMQSVQEAIIAIGNLKNRFALEGKTLPESFVLYEAAIRELFPGEFHG